MKFEIKSRFTGEVIFSLETDSLKLAVEAAVKSGANLEGADLRGANLGGANQRVVQISTIRDQIIAIGKDVSIGCEKHTLAYWLEHYEAIGKANEYSESEIELYGKLLKALE
jgi:Pentapeptide repeats (8 copies)